MDGKRGRPRRDTLSPVAERFRWLILQLKGEGLSEPEIGSRIGFKAAYINAVVNWETSGRKSVGAEIPGMVKKGLGVDVDYFYDEYSGERPYKLYLLDAQREKARLAELDHKLADLRRELGNAAALRADDNVRTTEVLARLAAAVARIDQRMGRLEESSGLNQLSLPPEGSPEHEPVRKHGHGKNASVKPRKPHRG